LDVVKKKKKSLQKLTGFGTLQLTGMMKIEVQEKNVSASEI